MWKQGQKASLSYKNWTRLEEYGMSRGRTPPQINVSEKKKEKKNPKKMKIGDKNDLKKLIYGVL